MTVDMNHELYEITRTLGGMEYRIGAMDATEANAMLAEAISTVRRLANAVDAIHLREVALRERVLELEGAMVRIGNNLAERVSDLEDRNGR